eukprot:3720704-Pleurochrysis_carterae.AAC.2
MAEEKHACRNLAEMLRMPIIALRSEARMALELWPLVKRRQTSDEPGWCSRRRGSRIAHSLVPLQWQNECIAEKKHKLHAASFDDGLDTCILTLLTVYKTERSLLGAGSLTPQRCRNRTDSLQDPNPLPPAASSLQRSPPPPPPKVPPTSGPITRLRHRPLHPPSHRRQHVQHRSHYTFRGWSIPHRSSARNDVRDSIRIIPPSILPRPARARCGRTPPPAARVLTVEVAGPLQRDAPGEPEATQQRMLKVRGDARALALTHEKKTPRTAESSFEVLKGGARLRRNSVPNARPSLQHRYLQGSRTPSPRRACWLSERRCVKKSHWNEV